MLLAILLVGIASGAQAPMLPSFFYGEATVNGDPVPKGSVIKALVNGTEAGSIEVDENGLYGEADTDNKLAVLGAPGDEVSFSLKMPGYEEIGTNQTAAWKSGERIELDLIFKGEEIRVMPSSGTSGGSSGGGSGGGGSIQQEKVMQFYFNELQKGKQVDVELEDMPVSKIRLIPAIDKSNVTLRIDVVDDISYPLELPVYRYVSVQGLEGSIEEAILFFKVPNDWVNQTEGNVGLYHLEDDWVKLETVIHGSGSDAKYHYYRARTLSFSEFAIAAEMVNTDQEEEAEEEIEDEQPKKEETQEDLQMDLSGLSKADEEGSGERKAGSALDGGSDPIIGMGIFVGLIVMGLLVYFIARRGDKR